MPQPTSPTLRVSLIGSPRPRAASTATASGGRWRAQPHRFRLGLQCELTREEAVRLRHRRLGSIGDVHQQLPAVREITPARVHVAGPLPVDQEEMAGPRPACDVDVLAKLDVTLRPQDHEAPVAPGAEAVRREPVDAGVAAAAIAAKDYVAEVLELRP